MRDEVVDGVTLSVGSIAKHVQIDQETPWSSQEITPAMAASCCFRLML